MLTHKPWQVAANRSLLAAGSGAIERDVRSRKKNFEPFWSSQVKSFRVFAAILVPSSRSQSFTDIESQAVFVVPLEVFILAVVYNTSGRSEPYYVE